MNTQVKIQIPDDVLLVDVLGTGDDVLNTIKDNFPEVKFSIIGDGISVFGSEEDVDSVVRIFDKILEYVDTNEHVNGDTALTIINQIKNNNDIEFQESDIILKYGKKTVRCKTAGQRQYLQSMRDNYITIVEGAAGSSKTYLSLCYGLSLLLNKDIDKLIICRPSIPADEGRGSVDLGALPGDVFQKMSLLGLPQINLFERILGAERFDRYLEEKKIEFLPPAYLRGYSMYRSLAIVDECQNMSVTIAKLMATRIGWDSKIIFAGDLSQTDFKDQESGLKYLLKSLDNLDGVGIVRLDGSDIVRHPLIPKMIERFNEYQ